MRFVFVMDSLDRVSPDKDTSFGFIEAASGRDHECLHCLIHQVEYFAGTVTAVVRRMTVSESGLELEGGAERVRLAEVDAVFIRKDPPFDQAYAHATLLLELLRGQTLMVNDPRGLRDANEKLYTLSFKRWMPPTLVSSDRQAIHDFIEEIGGKGVIKPLDGAGGYGVLGVRTSDSNTPSIIDLLTREGTRLAVVQKFIPAISEGDKRVLLLDGEPLGAILRRPKRGDLRANIHAGAEVTPHELTDHERTMIADMAPQLRADGLFFVGLDVIGDQLTEVNVTSPTGMQELSRFTGARQSDRVIAWVEQAARKSCPNPTRSVSIES
jgi:glutathione synthase